MLSSSCYRGHMAPLWRHLLRLPALSPVIIDSTALPCTGDRMAESDPMGVLRPLELLAVRPLVKVNESSHGGKVILFASFPHHLPRTLPIECERGGQHISSTDAEQL